MPTPDRPRRIYAIDDPGPAPSDPPPVIIRSLAYPEDLPGLAVIEDATAATPLAEHELATMLAHRNHWGYRDTHGLVAAVCGGRSPVGCAIWRAARGSLELLMFAVHPLWQRHGVGRQLMGGVFGEMSLYNNRAMIVVRETALPGQLFLQVMGFRAVMPIVGGYFGEEDGYVMEYRREGGSGE